MAKILILGGYGAVGREAATALVRHASQSVISSYEPQRPAPCCHQSAG
jgi:uncharacterized protein YbjT (DUF2867 family)